MEEKQILTGQKSPHKALDCRRVLRKCLVRQECLHQSVEGPAPEHLWEIPGHAGPHRLYREVPDHRLADMDILGNLSAEQFKHFPSYPDLQVLALEAKFHVLAVIVIHHRRLRAERPARQSPSGNNRRCVNRHLPLESTADRASVAVAAVKPDNTFVFHT